MFSLECHTAVTNLVLTSLVRKLLSRFFRWFAKKDDTELFMDNVDDCVAHGIIHLPHIESLLKQMVPHFEDF